MAEASRIAVLQNIDGSNRFRLLSSHSYTVGRGEQATLKVADTTVSRVHATIFWDGRAWVIVDCSTYGTYVNDKPIHKHRLSPGDQIRVSENFQWVFSEELGGPSSSDLELTRTGDSAMEDTARIVTSSGPITTGDVSIIGTSSSTQSLRSHVSKTAEGTGAVLIRGELGVGKMHIARAIHAAGPNRRRPMLVLDCAVIDGEQWEAVIQNDLKRQSASQLPGTIVFQRICSLSIAKQAQLIDAMRDLSRLTREGESAPRIVSITERNLESRVERGEFLADLLVRVAVIQILVDPLRIRREDVSELARHFLRTSACHYGRNVNSLRQDAITTLEEYNWPGNVQELQNTIDRAVMLCSPGSIALTDVDLKRGISEASGISYSMAGLSLEDIEKLHIDATLKATGWKKSRTASILGIERSTLDRKIKRYRLVRPPKATPRTVGQ